MNKLFIFFCILNLISCTSVQIDNQTMLRSVYYPVHTQPYDERHMSKNREYIHSFTDLDGNQYVTKWASTLMPIYNEDTFKTVVNMCSSYTRGFFPKDLTTVKAVSKSDLVYKKVVFCIQKEGFELIESRAHNPVEVIIALSKYYFSHGEKVGAGGKVRINSKELQLVNILPKAHECLIQYTDKYQQGHAGRHIYINMGPVIDGFSLCMENHGFTVIDKKQVDI